MLCCILRLSWFLIKLLFTTTFCFCVALPKVRPFLLKSVSLESEIYTRGYESENWRFFRLASNLLSSSESKFTELFMSLNITDEWMPIGLTAFYES
jgi:hypothetical protein